MPKTILIAASGTGGHLFPALYIARALKEISPDVRVEFVGAGRPLEQKLIPGSGCPLHTIKMVGVNKRGVKGIFEFLTVFPFALLQTWKLLTTVKPSAVVGVGGYASVLPILLAALRGIPTWIHEAELKPGLANTVLSYVAKKISLAYRPTKMPFKSRTVLTGHPTRPELSSVSTQTSKETLLRNLLVMGGSQGSERIDTVMIEIIPKLISFLKDRGGLNLVHQCRTVNEKKLCEFYQNGIACLEAKVVPFIEDLPSEYSKAHVIVSRAGAGTVTELAIVNRPVVLVPLPIKAIHQHENAQVLVDRGKAILVEEGEKFGDRLLSAICVLFIPENYFTMQNQPLIDRHPDAAYQIASGILEISA